MLYHVPRKVRDERIEVLLKLFELWDRQGRVREDVLRRHEAPARDRARASCTRRRSSFSTSRRSGLDPQSRNQLWTHVKHLNETEGVTVFLTTHYMDEAERVAHRIAIIDHGKIVAQGSAQELKEQTGTDSLEEAFLALTGSTIRDERADSADQMRQMVADVEAMSR